MQGKDAVHSSAGGISLGVERPNITLAELGAPEPLPVEAALGGGEVVGEDRLEPPLSGPALEGSAHQPHPGEELRRPPATGMCP